VTVLYKAQSIRPSINDLFAFECPMVFNLFETESMAPFGKGISGWMFGKDTPGWINLTYEELISWEEIFNRKDELRPDLKNIIQYYTLTDMGTSSPMYNPFSLTFTELWEFDSLENAKTTIDNILNDDGINILTKNIILSNNIFIEKLFINGVKVDNWVPKIKI
jgi:hypothetical protein